MGNESDLKFSISLLPKQNPDASANQVMRSVRVYLKRLYRRIALRGLHLKVSLSYRHSLNKKGMAYVHFAYVRCQEDKELAVRCFLALFHALAAYLRDYHQDQSNPHLETYLKDEMDKHQVSLAFEAGETLIDWAETRLRKRLVAAAGKYDVLLQARTKPSCVTPTAPKGNTSTLEGKKDDENKHRKEQLNLIQVDDQARNFELKLLELSLDPDIASLFYFEDKQISLKLDAASLAKIIADIDRFVEKGVTVFGIPGNGSQVKLAHSLQGKTKRRGRTKTSKSKKTRGKHD